MREREREGEGGGGEIEGGRERNKEKGGFNRGGGASIEKYVYMQTS